MENTKNVGSHFGDTGNPRCDGRRPRDDRRSGLVLGFMALAMILGASFANAMCSPNPTSEDPLVLAALQVWHGLPSHSMAFSGAPWEPYARAYDSRDPSRVAAQIAAAKDRGVSGFVIDWFGPEAVGLLNNEDRTFMDAATQVLFQQAELDGDFCLALLYDEGAVRSDLSGLDPSMYQGQALADLSYADENYFSSPAYLKLESKPTLLVFSFDNVEMELDWSELKAGLGEVTLIDKDPNPYDPVHDSHFDGFFAWVYPGAEGWDPLGKQWGKPYLEWFYATMRSTPYMDKVTVGGVWPGFDDSLAPWGENRFMSRDDGALYDATWNLATLNEARIVMIATWNDFEEGTDVEYGVRMVVDMDAARPENPGRPEILMRGSPLEVTWIPGAGDDVLQVYENGMLIYEEVRTPPVVLAFESGQAYELKVWGGLPGDPREQTVKIRRQDPDPTLVFCDGFESGDPSRWSAHGPS